VCGEPKGDLKATIDRDFGGFKERLSIVNMTLTSLVGARHQPHCTTITTNPSSSGDIGSRNPPIADQIVG
jgi:hypothetical protein